MSRYYNINNKKLPSVTTIISDCTNNSAPLTQWAANMCKEWVIENCSHAVNIDDLETIIEYRMQLEQLDEMRFNFRKVSQKALDVGSEVHNAIEKYLLGKLNTSEKIINIGKVTEITSSPKEFENAFNAFLEWEKEHNLKPISLEQTVYSDRWAGTLDFYGYFNGKLYVIDWKSSKAHYPEMRYQVAAYREAKQIEDINNFGFINDFGDKSLNIKKCIQGCGVLRLDKETGMPDWKDTSKTYEQDLEVFNRMVDLFYARHPRIAKKVKGE